jgi:hypothetical protein
MILRPLQSAAPPSGNYVPAWDAVVRLQRQSYESCWMITQPSHAALAGELAANLDGPGFPPRDQNLLRAIALHDAGWGMPDAQAIMHSRSLPRRPPQSFLATSISEFLEAWTKSIETGESVSPAGGYVVSRHFWRLAGPRTHTEERKSDRQKLESFLKHEEQRQKRLVARQSLAVQQLEDLTDLLQFCDLLSLYFCSGTRENVIFPEYFGVQLRATYGYFCFHVSRSAMAFGKKLPSISFTTASNNVYSPGSL